MMQRENYLGGISLDPVYSAKYPCLHIPMHLFFFQKLNRLVTGYMHSPPNSKSFSLSPGYVGLPS